MLSSTRIVLALAIASPLALIAACGKEESKSSSKPSGAHSHDDGHDHGHDHGHDASVAGHGGPIIALGAATIGVFSAVATRDEGEIIAGKDAPIDVTVTPAPGTDSSAVAVRFWIGTEDAKGSVKAKAAIENPAEPNRWHTHAEIPNPLPENSKLWVEIEDDKGGTSVGSFDLKV